MVDVGMWPGPHMWEFHFISGLGQVLRCWARALNHVSTVLFQVNSAASLLFCYKQIRII
jgi:hypothetical protein